MGPRVGKRGERSVARARPRLERRTVGRSAGRPRSAARSRSPRRPRGSGRAAPRHRARPRACSARASGGFSTTGTPCARATARMRSASAPMPLATSLGAAMPRRRSAAPPRRGSGWSPPRSRFGTSAIMRRRARSMRRLLQARLDERVALGLLELVLELAARHAQLLAMLEALVGGVEQRDQPDQQRDARPAGAAPGRAARPAARRPPARRPRRWSRAAGHSSATPAAAPPGRS